MNFSRRIHFFYSTIILSISIIIACNHRHTSREERSGRSSHQEAFLGKGVLEICCNFTGEHPCRSVISIKILGNFIKITLRHGYSPVNLLHIFRKPFHKNIFGWLLLERGIIPFYVFQDFLLFPSTTNLVSSSHWEKKLVFPDFSQTC